MSAVKTSHTAVRIIALVLPAAVLSACASSSGSSLGRDSAPTHVPIDPWQVAEPVPKAEPRSRYGNPKSYEVFGKRYYVLASARGYKERGIASWYGTKFHGKRTSSGEPYDMFAMTAAHKSLPLPSYVRVTNLENNRSLIVRVNDRGPFHPGRIIDLSYTAAVRLGVYAKGSAQVEVEALDAESMIAKAQPVTVQAPASSSQPVDELEKFLQELPAHAPGPKLPFLEIASFRNIEDCDALLEELKQQRLLALQVLEQDQHCLLVQGPFASAEDAETQSEAVRALGHSPTIIYP